MKSIRKLLVGVFQVAFFLLCSTAVYSQSNDLDGQVQALQNSIDTLERDVAALEKNLLFPPLTRVEVYLSHSPEVDFILRSLTLYVDGEEKSFHIYTDKDISALQLGGLQQFWEGNVALGFHNLKAQFEGTDRRGNVIKKTVDLEFEKALGGRAFELQVMASGEQKDLAFAVKDWGVK